MLSRFVIANDCTGRHKPHPIRHWMARNRQFISLATSSQQYVISMFRNKGNDIAEQILHEQAKDALLASHAQGSSDQALPSDAARLWD